MAKRLALMLLAILVLTGIAASQDRRSPDFETVEGTWFVDVTPVGRPTAQILSTYARGGTVIADGNAAQPTLRSPWHGVWARVSYLEFESTWHRYDFDAGGNWTGRSEFRQSIQVSPTQQAFSGASQTRVYDRAGNLMATINGTIRAVRVNVAAIQ